MKKLIAMVEKLEQLRPSDYQSPEIKITIAQLDEHDGKPRNWQHEYEEPRNSTGGCWAYMFAARMCDGVSVLWNCFGPEIMHGQGNDYKHAARAFELIQKRMEKLVATRGATNDAAELMGRWLESAGIETVYLRPDAKQGEWLNKGEWRTLTIGQMVNECRRNYPKPEAQAATAAA